MNSVGIHPIWLSSLILGLILGTTPAFSEVGEFAISESLIREFEILTNQNKPFTKKGRLVRPSMDIRMSPLVKDSGENISFDLNIDLEGTSKSRSYTPVTGNKGVTADITAHVKAEYQQAMSFDGEKLVPGEFSGSSQITPGPISVQNNFGLLNGLVNKKARQKAPAQVRSEIPQEKKDLEEQIRTEIEKGVSRATVHLDTLNKQIHQVFTETQNFPFDSQFSSKAGPQGGIQLKFSDVGDSPTRGAKPEFSLRDQIASSGVFHEDLLTKTLSKEIAGKEMKIAELQAHLCSPNIASLINFCDQDKSVEALGLSVVFDEKEPIKFKFENGKVSIQINAKNRLGIGSHPLTTTEFEPYQVNISYALKDGMALLEDISVRGMAEASAPVEKPKTENQHGANKSWLGVWNRITTDAESLVSSATKSGIEKEFRKIMKEKIEFPIVSFPTKLKTDPAQPTFKAEVLEAASLVPMEVKAENGWLAVSAALCKENIKPLGVSFDKNNRISAIQPGSPAALSGFKLGDRIESYGSSDGRNTALISDIDPFIEFIEDHSLSKSTTTRVVELSGKSASGVPFKRSLSLCPSQISPREEAEKLLSLGSEK